VDLTLPSGMTIKARRPDPLQMAMWRRLPLSLAAASAEPGRRLSAEELMENVEAARQMLLYCCISPRISLDPQGDDEIHPRDIPLADSTFLLRWATRQKEADDLRPFCRESASDDPGDSIADVRAEAERPAGDCGPGAGAGPGPGGGGDPVAPAGRPRRAG
jgi:hypothetical protein